jgi:putative phosphoesterase
MKIAVISDIHGNVVALETVLKDLEQQGNADHIVVTGDIFAYGPAPYEVFVTLQQLPNASFLLGNTDRYLLEGTYPSTSGGEEWWNRLLLSFHWTAEHMGREGHRFLETLPLSQIIQEGDWRLLAVHGSPRSDEEGLTLKTCADDFDKMLDSKPDIVVCGHTHVPMDRIVNGVRVANVGSVGLPFDGDPRACYAIISPPTAEGGVSTERHPDSSCVELRRVVYDVEKAVEQFYAASYPAADVSAYNLWTGRPFGSSLIYTPEMRHPGPSPLGNGNGESKGTAQQGTFQPQVLQSPA